jgi:hypothetical protein
MKIGPMLLARVQPRRIFNLGQMLLGSGSIYQGMDAETLPYDGIHPSRVGIVGCLQTNKE